MTVWRLLDAGWPLAWPRARLRELIGPDALAALERCGISRPRPLAPGDPYPCRLGGGCAMQVVDEGGLRAACGGDPVGCADEPLPPEDAARCRIDADSLAAALQRALRVPAQPTRPADGALALGARRIGRAEARFLLVPRPRRWIGDGGLDRVVAADPDPTLVALVFTAAPLGAPRRLRGTRVAWVALAEALSLDGPTLDLAELWLSLAPDADLGPELWPRYAVAADPARGRYSYAGRPLPLERRPQEARLLLELLRQAGAWVPRAALMAALWPLDRTPSGRFRDPIAIERRLRQLKSDLSAVFAALPPVPGAAQDPIENLRAHGDDGGYRIAVPPDRIWWAPP